MRLIFSLSLGVALGLLIACCGQDTEDPPVVQTTNPITSIEGVVGKNNQGQLQVGGLSLNLAGSQLKIDGKSCGTGELQPGMTIEARGNMGANGQSFYCSDINVSSTLRGNVENTNLANTLVVAGITVVADDSTYIVRSYNGGMTGWLIGFGEIQAGDPVHVWGILQENGTILATRICVMPANSAFGHCYTFQGSVSNLDPNARRFRCGNYWIDYGNAAITGTISNGAQVVVSGPVNGNVLRADSVAVRTVEGVRSVSGRMYGLNEGLCQFTLGGGGCCGSAYYYVDYADAEVVGISSLATHKGNVRVEGTVTQNGKTYKLKATKVTK